MQIQPPSIMNNTNGWKNPEKSVGEECKFLKRRMNRVRVFQAIGPAREAWLRLEPHIFQKINDHKEEIERGVKQSSGYAINLYMAGSQPKSTLPTILVSSASKKERKAIKAIIESLLKDLPVNPGIQVKCFAEVPAILAAYGELPYTIPRNSSHGLTIEGSPTSLCGAQIVSGKSLATLGGAIYLKDDNNVTPFGLTVFHVGTYSEPIGYPAEGDDMEEFDFDESEDESDDENDEILEMASKSSLSFSREPSEESDERNNDGGLLESPKLSSKPSPGDLPQISLPSSAGGAENDTGAFSSPPSGLDYQLVPLQDYSPCPINQITIEDQRFIQPRFVAKEAKEVQIWAGTGMTEPVRGKLSLSPYLLKLPSYSLQKFWVVDLERNIMLGDSGSWIVDALSNVYGHIVAAAPGSFRAYILPLHRIFEDIEASTNCKPSLVCETEVHLGEELQLPIHQTSDLSSKGKNPHVETPNEKSTRSVITNSSINENQEQIQDGQNIQSHAKTDPSNPEGKPTVVAIDDESDRSSYSSEYSSKPDDVWDLEYDDNPSTVASTSKTKLTKKTTSTPLRRRSGPSRSIAFECRSSTPRHSGQNSSLRSSKPPPEPTVPTNSSIPTHTNPQPPFPLLESKPALPANNEHAYTSSSDSPGETYPHDTNYAPRQSTYAPAGSTYYPSGSTYYPPSRSYDPPGAAFYPPGFTYPPPGSTYPHPGSTYPPPGSTYPHPGSTYPPPGSTYPPPGSTYPPPGSTYHPPRSTYPPPSSTYPPSWSAYPPLGYTHPPFWSAYRHPWSPYSPDFAFDTMPYAAPVGGYAAPYGYYSQKTSIPTPASPAGYNTNIQAMIARAYSDGLTAGMQASALKPQSTPAPPPTDHNMSWQADAERDRPRRQARKDNTAFNDVQDARRDFDDALIEITEAGKKINEALWAAYESLYRLGEDERLGGDDRSRRRTTTDTAQRNYEHTGTQQASQRHPSVERTSAGQQANPPGDTTRSPYVKFWRPSSGYERIAAQAHPAEDPIDIGIFGQRSRPEAENVRIREQRPRMRE